MKTKQFKYIVDIDDIDTRLDLYMLDIFSEESRSALQRDIKEGKILVNENKVKTGYALKENDIITYIKTIEEDEEITPINLNLEIVYEDDYLLVVNKPKGLVVHPAASYKEETLVHGLLYQVDKLSNVGDDNRPGIVHRLDKDTSGLMVVAKTNDVHEDLSDQFRERTVIKNYYALVQGTFDESTGTINMPIKRDENNRLKMAVARDGRDAVTHFKVKEQYLRHALLDVDLETGRTHQIRVHLAQINHSILSDPLYGTKDVYDDYGQYLHSYKLTFVHPIKKEQMTFELSLPLKFKETIKNLAS